MRKKNTSLFNEKKVISSTWLSILNQLWNQWIVKKTCQMKKVLTLKRMLKSSLTKYWSLMTILLFWFNLIQQ